MSTTHTLNTAATNIFYPESLFRGPFSPASPKYIAMCATAVQASTDPRPPLITCKPHLVVFYTKCSPSTCYAVFELNHPITVLAFTNNAFAHTTYSMVRAINAWSDSSPHEVKYMVTVEVHLQQDFEFDWSNTVPWPGIMPHVPLIHPHTFLTASYTPLPLADILTDEISIVRYDTNCLDHLITLENIVV